MEFYAIYDIANSTRPPWWVMLVPAFRHIWELPVAQKEYGRVKPSRFPVIVITFISAGLISLAVNIIFRLSQGFDDLTMTAFSMSFTVYIPIGILIVISSFRIFFICLVGSVMRFRKRLESRAIESYYALPITDRGMYFGVLFPGIIRGLSVMENLIGISAGLFAGFFLVNGFVTNDWDYKMPDLLTLGSLFIMTIIFFSVFVYTYTAGLFSIYLPVFPAVFASVLHLFIFYGLATFGLMTMGMLTFLTRWGGADLASIIFSWIALILYGAFITWLTSQVGVMIFARRRRPGFYEPEWASGSGMVS